MNQIGKAIGIEVMTLLPQALDGAGIGELLSGKYKDYVSPFISQGHAAAERILPLDPTHVNAKRLVGPNAGEIKAFPKQGLHHSVDFDLRVFAGQARYTTDHSWHDILFAMVFF